MDSTDLPAFGKMSAIMQTRLHPRVCKPLLAACLFLCARASADVAPPPPVVTLGALRLAPQVQALGTNFVLHGAGFLRVGLVFKGYGAALYLTHPNAAAAIGADVPKRLEIFYLHRTPRLRMIETAETTLRRNLSNAEAAQVWSDVQRLHACYEDRLPGDVSALTYVPGRGTEFSVNGEPRILIPGAAFAAAYFQVWLGNHPSSQSVKDALLTPLRR